MSDTLERMLGAEGARAVLLAFGLDQILTAEDDPELWGAVVARYWPAPGEPDMVVDGLRFGIGRVVAEGEVAPSTRSGMEQIEVWCFEQVDADHLRPVDCAPEGGMSFMGMLAMGGQAAASDMAALAVREYIDIGRPSAGVERVPVHVGGSAPPNAGGGETRYWGKAEKGWGETDEVLGRWLT